MSTTRPGREEQGGGEEGVLRRWGRAARKRVRRGWLRLTGRPTPGQRHAAFVETFFEPGEYRRLAEEFRARSVDEHVADALRSYRRAAGDSSFGAIRVELGRDYYCLVRKLSPEVVVETGVCNGVSTLCILAALETNGAGELYSVDLPYRADESLEAFREETFDAYGGAAIPADREPGWIVPDRLRERWTLRLGRSQRELPRLRAAVEAIDLFIHDSEHSLPCMMFEFELAWSWLRPGGLLVADDVSANRAFELFVRSRGARHGLVTGNVGWALRGEEAG